MWEWLRRLFGGRQRKGAVEPQKTVKLPAYLVAWYNTSNWSVSRRWLEDHLRESPANGPALLEAFAEQMQSAGGSADGARGLAVHAKLLREAQRMGVDAAYRALADEGAFPREAAFPQIDDKDPSPKRQTELHAAYEENVKLGKPPYAGVVIRTQGELNWIVGQRGWQTASFETKEQTIDLRQAAITDAVLKNRVSDSNGKNGFDLRHANLSGAVINRCILRDAKLIGTNFSNASIDDTDFSGADWSAANLSGVRMTGCSLTETEFVLSNLSDTILLSCTLTRTQLTFANLTGAGISGEYWDFFRDVSLAAANLSGAVLLIGFKDSKDADGGSDLKQARMDSATMLGDSTKHGDDRFQFTDERARLLDVGWNGAVLANVRWESLKRLGEEADIKEAESRKDRINALRDAARAYRGLAKALQAQGLTDDALRFRARERQLERRTLLTRSVTQPWMIFPFLGSGLLNIVSGYGDRPWRSLLCYLIVIGAFTDAYIAITNQVFSFITSKEVKLVWYEALVLSISSFHGRGFFPTALNLGDPVAVVAAAEAIIGLFIEIVFIATFTQRFFAR